MIDSLEISVVVQGAIIKTETSKCLKSIRKFLPEAEIILSTWEESCVEGLSYDVLVLNNDPGGFKPDLSVKNVDCFGNNFNRQLVSTKGGLLKAKRKYILKLRSDLVLKNANFLNYWDKFDLVNNEYKLFKHRVLSSSLYAREYSCELGTGFPTPFHPSDFWFFGLNEDIKNYFEACPMQTEEEACNWDFKYPTRCPYTTILWRFAPEQFFCINWVKKYYPNIQFKDWSDWNPENIELSNNILYNNFVILGFEQSGIYSKKHMGSELRKNITLGLISFEHFQNQYKKYCIPNFKNGKIKKDYSRKLKQHLQKVTEPFCNLKKWFSELFSVAYYALACVVSRIKNLFKKNN